MQAHGTRLSYFVEGMDCANCVAQVERMVGGLPGTYAGIASTFARGRGARVRSVLIGPT